MDIGSDNPIAERVSLRPVVWPDDEEFLRKLYFTTREDDRAQWGLPAEMADSLIDMQYRAQKMQYDAEYPEMSQEIILLDGEDVGRLLSTRNEKEVLGIDFAVMPEYRSQGIGTAILNGLMNEAAEGGKPFNFSVVRTNSKAIKLYRRIGADFVGETVSHYLLQWQLKQDNEKL